MYSILYINAVYSKYRLSNPQTAIHGAVLVRTYKEFVQFVNLAVFAKFSVTANKAV